MSAIAPFSVASINRIFQCNMSVLKKRYECHKLEYRTGLSCVSNCIVVGFVITVAHFFHIGNCSYSTCCHLHYNGCSTFNIVSFGKLFFQGFFCCFLNLNINSGMYVISVFRCNAFYSGNWPPLTSEHLLDCLLARRSFKIVVACTLNAYTNSFCVDESDSSVRKPAVRVVSFVFLLYDNSSPVGTKSENRELLDLCKLRVINKPVAYSFVPLAFFSCLYELFFVIRSFFILVKGSKRLA